MASRKRPATKKVPRRQARDDAKRKSTRKRPPHPGEAERIQARREKALALRKAGASYRMIAKELDVSVETAHSDVAAELAALAEISHAHAEDVRALEIRRLDDLQVNITNILRSGATPRAVDSAIRLSERRSKLLGLDAPAKKQVSGPDGQPLGGVGISQQMIDEREEFLIVKMGELVDNVVRRLREERGEAAPEEAGLEPQAEDPAP